MKANITIGEKHSKLTVISVEESHNYIKMVKCLCDCGNIVICNYYQVRSGAKASCGCINKSLSANKTINGTLVGNAAKHNMKNTRIYSIWKNMKERCRNPNKSNYKYYGGRGILVCDRWKISFIDFYNDMGFPPTDKHTIDRINNNGNYELSNCKLSTQSEQYKNRRSSLLK